MLIATKHIADINLVFQ